MAYTVFNFKTKKALRAALPHGVHVFQPGGFPLTPTINSKGQKIVHLEGPHYPSPHTWYAQAEVNDQNEIIKIF